MRFFDTHCHLNFDQFLGRLDDVLAESRNLGVDKFVIPATQVSDFEKIVKIAEAQEGVYIAIGMHPFFIEKSSVAQLENVTAFISGHCNHSKLVAIGEVGLDKYCGVDMSLQQQVFEWHLSLADTYQLPVVLHNRKCDRLILEQLAAFPRVRGVIHGYSGSLGSAQRFIERGFKLGLGGVVTWDQASKVHRMVEGLNIKDVLLETDSPDMSPQWLKGRVNSPVALPRIAGVIANRLGVSLSELAEGSYINGCQLFGIEHI